LGNFKTLKITKLAVKTKNVILRMNEGNCTAAVRRAHSSKPAAAACGGWMGRTDRWTDARTDVKQFHKPCSALPAVPVSKQTMLDIIKIIKFLALEYRSHSYMLPGTV